MVIMVYKFTVYVR